MEVKAIGPPCAFHGAYTFYKALHIASSSSSSSSSSLSSSSSSSLTLSSSLGTSSSSLSGTTTTTTITTVTTANNITTTTTATTNRFIKNQNNNNSNIANNNNNNTNTNNNNNNNNNNGIMKYKTHGRKCVNKRNESFINASTCEENSRKSLLLKLGDCVPVRPWTDSPIACLAEIRMVWRDKNEQCLLIGLRLYFLPENTPMGRNCHGEDEVLAISDKVVIKAEDLLTWIDNNLEWNWGHSALYTSKLPLSDAQSDQSDNGNDPDGEDKKRIFGVAETQRKVAVLSYSKYCRYRATVKRLENVENEWMRNALVDALGGYVAQGPNTRIMFCKDTFDYPELETHDLLCNHLAPKFKGRPRGRRKKQHSESQSSYYKYNDTSDSESEESESSSCSSKLNLPKHKIPVQHLRFNQRPTRLKLKINDNENSDIRNNRRILPLSKEKIIDSKKRINEAFEMARKKDMEREFLKDLHQFMINRNTPIPKIVWLSLRNVNLFDVYKRVQESGGYETVSINKLWKILKKNSPGLTRKKYERVLLPYEIHHRNLAKLSTANNLVKMPRKLERLNVDENNVNNEDAEDNSSLINLIDGTMKNNSISIKSEKEKDIKMEEPELSREQMTEIQNKVKAKDIINNCDQLQQHLNMSSKVSVPVTVIVGASPVHDEALPSPQIQIQQPRTTITVHQTTIHPQPHHPAGSRNHQNQQITNQIQITNEIKIQQITLQPSNLNNMNSNDFLAQSTKNKDAKEELRLVGNAASGITGIGGNENNVQKTSLRHIRVKPNKKYTNGSNISITTSSMQSMPKENSMQYCRSLEKDSVYSVKNFATQSPEVIDLEDSDDERNNSKTSGTFKSSTSGSYILIPPIKKRKLDILREGGLEVTPIKSADNNKVSGNLNNKIIHSNGNETIRVPMSDGSSGVMTNTKIRDDKVINNVPKFQSNCMFLSQSKKIFGNPKDNLPPSAVIQQNIIGDVLDLTSKNVTTKPSIGGIEHDQQYGANNINNANILNLPPQISNINPNLLISFVPPMLRNLSEGMNFYSPPNLLDNSNVIKMPSYPQSIRSHQQSSRLLPPQLLPPPPPPPPSSLSKKSLSLPSGYPFDGSIHGPSALPFLAAALPSETNITNLGNLNTTINPFFLPPIYGNEGYFLPTDYYNNNINQKNNILKNHKNM